MIDNKTIRRIDELLQCKKLSQRQIAKQLKVSRGTVQSVANGKRKVREAEAKGKIPLSWRIPSGKPQRCRRCGALTKFPTGVPTFFVETAVTF
ncbi:MAG: helix-turn-helix transcriptional regulator [Planctomycetaceae bacterium]|nr:helix-turn-helix transcriptional regulator [Planctomycetaceae bacterium]